MGVPSRKQGSRNNKDRISGLAEAVSEGLDPRTYRPGAGGLGLAPVKIGGNNRIRTYDPLLVRQML